LYRDSIGKSERVVIKIGTKVITESDNSLSRNVISSIVKQIADPSNMGRDFIIVSSGAIALGLSRMGLDKRPKKINLLQAAASMGQSRLINVYESEFDDVNYKTSQILLTYEDIQNRERYLNIRNTIFTLWSYGVIPIVNENDTVSFSEIRFGDNDLIAAWLSNMIDADLLLILTDIDGVYNKNPNINSDAIILREIEKVDKKVKEYADGKGSIFSSGGMESKLKAAEIAAKSGIGVVIADGKTIDLKGLFDGKEIGTYFIPRERRIKGRKKWIAFNPKISGKLIIDKGGEKAIVHNKRSLLPAGIVDVIGDFNIGSNVSIQNEEHKEIARGLSNFSSKEIKKIKGLNTKKIADILDVETYFDEVVHRDNMVILI